MKKQPPKKDYMYALRNIHKLLNPSLYVEIGVQLGYTLRLANETTKIIGVDPEPMVEASSFVDAEIFALTSDNFFAQTNFDKTVDFAFIDGMHLFEFVLRDFINLEKVSSPRAIIAFHDTIPTDFDSSARERHTSFWTGDVFKIVMVLKKYRPDLKMVNFDVTPSGLCLVKNLNSKSTILQDNYEEIIRDFTDLTYDNIKDNLTKELCIKAFDKKTLKCFIK